MLVVQHVAGGGVVLNCAYAQSIISRISFINLSTPPADEGETMPAISVNVTLYNCEQYLRQTLESVLAQTFTDWECVMVDDASPDGSADIAREFQEKDARFKLIRIAPEDKQPFPYVRNVALKASSSPWIAVLDGDDWWEPWKLERQMAAVKAAPETLICATRAWIWADGATAGLINPFTTDQIEETLPIRNVFAHSTMLISRHAMNELGGYDLTSRTSQDWALWVHMYWKYGADRFMILDDISMYYRRHTTSITTQPVRCLQFEWRVVNYTLAKCGWGLRRPRLAWRVMDYWSAHTLGVYRQAEHHAKATWWALIFLMLRPISVWRWKQLARIFKGWCTHDPKESAKA